MTVTSAANLKTYFGETKAPTCAQFSDLIDSLFARGSAAGTAQGLESLGGGTVGTIVFQANTTASARSHLGVASAAAVGQTVMDAATTASAQTVIGGGVAGRQVFGAITTASAFLHLGLPSTFAVATTAQVSGPTDTSAAFLTPALMHYHPLMPKAWVRFNGAGTVSVHQSWNVGSVGDIAAGHYRLTWGSAFPNNRYGLIGGGQRGAQGFIEINIAETSGAGTITAADCQIVSVCAGGTPGLQDSSAITVMVFDR